MMDVCEKENAISILLLQNMQQNKIIQWMIFSGGETMLWMLAQQFYTSTGSAQAPLYL